VSVLSDLNVGEYGVVISLDLPDTVQNHLMHMGFVPDARVTALRRAPAGDPTVYTVDGLEIALRRETASAIVVRMAEGQGSATIHQDEGAHTGEGAQEDEGARALAGAAL
jgi:ferrous iron transport protein A